MPLTVLPEMRLQCLMLSPAVAVCVPRGAGLLPALPPVTRSHALYIPRLLELALHT